ncbi:peroxisomal carnitine O-octanoyltransferase isoform X2 [Nematostella vectensis]|uniref:peroxisomal carnitine O-octanoyltransferase isoform X2 n=1 Tax=Nematostella vectensis TaxID=45351 RepID=UPI0020777C0A|nr:peroxisomal carnitine O-octanoyltransferase isoform X2 [Nematostella vectensis]
MFRGILLTSSSTRSAVLLWSEWAQKFIRARSCVNLVHLKKMSSKQETTFMYQEHLPSLPVQTLEHTCGKYLESVKHLLTDEEYMQTEFVVNEFQSGIGKKLQQKLEKRGKEHRNWLSQWWEEEAYLRPRSPVAPLVNIGGPFMMQEDVWPPAEGTLLKRAAFVIFALLDTWQKIYRQQLKIGKMGNKPLCMSQYLRLFSECRIPGKDLDSLKAHFCLAPEKPPRHIMVQTNGRIFTCYVLDENYEPLTPPDIERQLEAVVKMAKSRPLGPCIGALTAEDRTTWYQSRNLLIALDGKNGEYLHAIETAMVNLVLDYECEGKDYQEVTHNSILGDCRNRWFDKSITVIGCKMGTFATNCDHSPFDGIVEISTMIDASVMIRKFNGEWQGRQHIGNVTPPSELDFVVDDQMLKCVKTAVDKYQKEADRIIIIDTKTTMFGKNHIKRLGVHPDTFCQLAIQLTYYRMHNKPGTAYETAQTRQFYHGRTDTVRSCTAEAVEWCKAMVSPHNVSEKALLLKKAADKHNKLMMEATNGQGIDRHLMGLAVIAAKEGIPTPNIFTDKAWKASGGGANFKLSTSCTGFWSTHGGCAPMVHDGYGFFYSIEEEEIYIILSAFKDSTVTDAPRFEKEFTRSLIEMSEVLQSAKL